MDDLKKMEITPENLSEKIPENVREVLARLEKAGYEGWCVGGAVRDLLLGREPGDWDVAASSPPEKTLNIFSPRAWPTGLQHGTVTVAAGGGSGNNGNNRNNGNTVEVTTFRRDGDYTDSRHPDHVEFTGSLDDDLSRRDFTVNAIALNLRGELRDPFGGRADLRSGILRAVGEPERRFGEDALRILRGLRFSSKLGFSIEPETAGAMRRCSRLLKRIAKERIQVELSGLLCGNGAAEVLMEYPDVLGVFLPEILPSVGFDQHSPYHCYDVWEHTARSVAAVRPDPVLRYTMLFHDLGKPEAFFLDGDGTGHFYGHWRQSVQIASAAIQRLRLDNRSRDLILTLVERHGCELSFSERSVRRNLGRYGEKTLRLLLEVKRADNLAQSEAFRDRLAQIDEWEALLEKVLASDDCFSLKQLEAKGGDLTALGLRGREVGNTLDKLLELVIDGKLPNEKAILLEYAKENLL